MAAAPPVDLVTALQEALGRANAVLFNYIGALQRDAPPALLKGEPLVAPPKTYDVQVGAAKLKRERRARLLRHQDSRRAVGCCLKAPVLLCSSRPAPAPSSPIPNPRPILSPPSPTAVVQAQAELMSRDLTASLQEVEGLIQRLPQLPASEPAEVAQAVALMQQNAVAAAELAAELATAGTKLAQLQEAHGALAEAALAHKAAAAAAAAAAVEKSGGSGGDGGS